jgi:hypothetical protein
MPDDLYDRDVLEWSVRQAERLRRVARGERVNDVDWDHVIEEIEEVGKSELNGVRSLLERTLEHLLKAAAWPTSRDRNHWLAEAANFADQAAERYGPAMRQHLDIDKLYRRALRLVSTSLIDDRPPGALPDECPFAPDDLLAEEFDAAAAAERLQDSASARSNDGRAAV